MLNILQLNKYYPPHCGGIENVVEDVAESLNGRTEMNVLVCSDDYRKEDTTTDKIHLHRSRTLCKVGSMPASFSYLRDVKKAAKKADVVLLHMPFPWGDLALRLSGYRGKVVLWWHSDVVRQKKLLQIYKPLMNWTLRRADAIVVATEGHIKGSSFINKYKSKCKVIPYGISETFIQEGINAKKQTEDTNNVRFLFVGRMVYYKGCDVLVKSFANMKNKNCILEYIGGKTAITEKCISLAEELGVDDRVTFHGSVSSERLKQYLADCDVLVLPSTHRSEAFALVQLEAMAYGMPVINTNLPSGVPYVSCDGETGLTVEPGDVQGLADAMDILANDAELRESYSEAAYRRVKDFRMNKMANSLLELFIEQVSK